MKSKMPSAIAVMLNETRTEVAAKFAKWLDETPDAAEQMKEALINTHSELHKYYVIPKKKAKKEAVKGGLAKLGPLSDAIRAAAKRKQKR